MFWWNAEHVQALRHKADPLDKLIRQAGRIIEGSSVSLTELHMGESQK